VESFYDPREGLSRSDWERWLHERLTETVALAYRRTPAGRRAVEATGRPLEDLRLPHDLSQLPLLRKSELPALQAAAPPLAGWNALPVEALRRLFVSPGPIYDPEGAVEDYWGFAAALHGVGFRRGDLVLNTFAYHLTPAGAMLEDGLTALGCPVIPGGTGSTEIQARTARDLKVRGYVGTPSFMATLLEKMEGGSSLQVAFVSGEMLTSSLRGRLEAPGVRVGQGYATGDVGLIAYECHEQNGLHLASRVFVEIVDVHTGHPCPAGETGEVVVTFLSEIYPVLRLATGDLSKLEAASCACGRGAPRLAGVLGRVGQSVKVRGMFVHPNDVRRAMGHFPQIARYQMVVTRHGHLDELTARIEAPDELAHAVAERLREEIKVRAEVEIVGAGTLPDGGPLIKDERVWA
jgi:phenylacetate-CoA ligase